MQDSNDQEKLDRNLLRAFLALQLGFVNREQLVTAFRNWSDPQGDRHEIHFADIAPESAQLLDALVDEHLDLHGRNLNASLAALSSVDSVKDELATLGDETLNASLPKLRDKSPEAYRPGGDSEGESSRFRIVRPHARGGLGQVSLAQDQQLAREVALKELQDRFADDPDTRNRFTREAEITGRLEHPGIVPIYGAGHYADGRPYYAMRFIQGDSLREAIDQFHSKHSADTGTQERSSDLRKLLRRFIDVCDAIEYAHSRGVLHRDLKPGNIMLGRFGETLVVDWGLAKSMGESEPSGKADNEALVPTAQGSGSVATLQGSTVGTPCFMSPEQAAGKLDQLGPVSDVYSLGATLYTLLTGKPPYHGEPAHTVVELVKCQSPRAPRELNPAIERALEAICLKAMARDPASRYSSPQALASDVERWLSDEPISAMRDPLPVRCFRWAKRHKATTAVLITSLLLASIAGFVISAITSDSNRRLAEKEAVAVEARNEAVEARNEAVEARNEAVEARDKAVDLAQKNEQLATAAQHQLALSKHDRGRQFIDSDNDGTGLLTMLSALATVPESHTELRDYIERDINAFARGKMLARAKSIPSTTILERLSADRVLIQVPSEDFNPNEDSLNDWGEGQFDILVADWNTLEPVSERMPSDSWGDYEVYSELDRVFVVSQGVYEDVPPEEIERLPEELYVTDENRDRVQIRRAKLSVSACQISDGQRLDAPLEVYTYEYSIIAASDPSQPLDYVLYEVDPIRDELIGIDGESGVLVLGNLRDARLEAWNLFSGEQIALDLPLTQAEMSESMICVQPADTELSIYQLTDPASEKTIAYDAPILAFNLSYDANWVAAVTEDGQLHVQSLSDDSQYTSTDTLDAEDPTASIEMAGSSIYTQSYGGIIRLWKLDTEAESVSFVRSNEDGLEAADPNFRNNYIEVDAYFADEQGEWLLVETGYGDRLDAWYVSPANETNFAAPLPPAPYVDDGRAPPLPATMPIPPANGYGQSWSESSATLNEIVVTGEPSSDSNQLQPSVLHELHDGLLGVWANGHFTLYDLEARSQRTRLPLASRDEARFSREQDRLLILDEHGRLQVRDLAGNLIAQSSAQPPGYLRSLLVGSADYDDAIHCVQTSLQDELLTDLTLLEWTIPPQDDLQSEPRALAGANWLETRVQVEGLETTWLSAKDPMVVAHDGSFGVLQKPNWNDPSQLQFQIIQGPDFVGQPEVPLLTLQMDHPAQVQSLHLSPDNQRLAIVCVEGEFTKGVFQVLQMDLSTGSEIGDAISADGSTRSWRNLETGFVQYFDQAHDFSPSLDLFCGVPQSDQPLPLEGARDLRVWNLSDGKVLADLPHASSVSCCRFTPDGQKLLSACRNGDVHTWDALTGKPTAAILPHSSEVTELLFPACLPNHVITITEGLYWRIWNYDNGEAQSPRIPFSRSRRRVAKLSPDGRVLVALDAGGRLEQWDVQTQRQLGPTTEMLEDSFRLEVDDQWITARSQNESWWRFARLHSQSQVSGLDSLTDWVAAITTAKWDGDSVQLLSPDDLTRATERVQQPSFKRTDETPLPTVIELGKIQQPQPPSVIND